MTVLGLDVGGTKLLGIAIDPAEPTEVRSEQRVPTPEGGAGLVDALLELTRSFDPAPTAIGVGLPGLVDRDGTMRMGPHLRHVQDLPLAEELCKATGLRAVVHNDANCHAAAEHACGAAAGAQEALVVTLGTGIGAGIISGGELLFGAGGFAGEAGHMVVDPSGPPCPCGRRGCWERFASGGGLGRLGREAADAGLLDAALTLADGDPEAVRGEHVTQAAREGDEQAREVLRSFAWWIALGLANLANLLDPEVIVIGGGLVDDADLFLPEVRDRVGELVMASDRREEIRIVPAELGVRAGAIGAALLAAE